MKIKFDSNLSFQQEAISAIVDIFKGQEVCASNFTVFSPEYLAKNRLLEFTQLGYANKLQLSEAQILENLQKIQLRNGLRPSVKEEVAKENYDFSIEMETGTGKTYVYLRTMMELNKNFGFTKFIIVVPSIPIKEGVYKSLEMTESHLKELYNNINYKYFIYDSSRLNEIRDFATNDQLQIMVINIDAFRRSFENIQDESKQANIIHRYNDKLGYKPLTLIQETKPVVIIDEPQSTISTDLAKRAVKNLNPLFMIRYSATHRDHVNLVFKLDAVDAYNRQLVKQIEVATVSTMDTPDAAYLKLLSVDNRNGISAKVELDIMQGGRLQKRSKQVRKNDDLLQIANRQEYEGFQVYDIYTAQGYEYIEFINGKILKLGEVYGSLDDLQIKRFQIRKTIEEHLEKELLLNPRGIKVLSLFFIDAVKNYRIYDDEGNTQNGIYAKIFEEEYKNTIRKLKYHILFEGIRDLDAEAIQVHNGYFSIDKRTKASNKKEKFEYYKDTSGNTKADEDTFNLIMKDKEKLLSFDSKLRFIFSHSALKEGWDNPNVFQICTLKEAGASEIRRRQEIGRGLRLSVNQDGERVQGFDVNTLTVMASESYEAFVDNLQKEMEEDTGIRFGFLQDHAFSSVVVDIVDNEPEYWGHKNSQALFDFFTLKGYIDTRGKVLDTLREDLREENITFPEEYDKHIQNQIIGILKQVAGKLEIKKNEDRVPISINKEVFLSEDFKSLWDKIKHKTTYAVNFDSQQLIKACASHISKRLVVSRGKLIYKKARIGIGIEGITMHEGETSIGIIDQKVEFLPDIVGYLQNETQLTRRSIVEILRQSGKLELFKINPQKFIEGCIDIINEQMRLHIVDGIVYTRIGDHECYSQELFQNEQLTGYLHSNMLVSSKSPYEHIVYDSHVESDLAREFERNNNVKVYAKLPAWFKIDTPLGTYNPDWAVLFELDGTEKLFFVVESKGTMGYDFLRPAEQGKIACGKQHFHELASSTGSNIRLEHVSNIDDFINAALQNH